MSTLIIAKNTTSTGTDNNMQTSVTLLRAFTMCGTIGPFYCFDNSFIKNFVNVYCPNTMCLGIFFLRKSFSITWKKWLSMSSIHVHLPSPQYSLWRRKKKSFCWSLTEWFTFVNRWKTQVNMFLEISIVQHVETENVHLLFWRKISANHNQAYISLCPKRQKRQYVFGIIVSTSQWLIHLLENSFSVSFHTPSIYSQARWLSRSPTKLLSFFQTLDQIQLLWL